MLLICIIICIIINRILKILIIINKKNIYKKDIY